MYRTFLAGAFALLAAAATAQAATLTTLSVSGSHFHSGGNVGLAYRATTDADRTKAIPVSPGGLALLSTQDRYSGDIGAVLSQIRIGAGEATATTFGLIADDGFFFNSTVASNVECVDTNIPGCTPFMGSRASLSHAFTPDTTTTLFFEGSWFGGNGNESLVSVVDFLAITLQEQQVSGAFLDVFNVDTNLFNRNEQAGPIDDSVALTAGRTYRFSFDHRSAAQSASAPGATDTDSGTLVFAASVIESNATVSSFQDRFDAALAPVPLPTSGVLILLGLGALGVARLRRRT